jgi:hypothetical protein
MLGSSGVDMSQDNKAEGGEPDSVPPAVAIDWGYDTPVASGVRLNRPAVIATEITIAPAALRSPPTPIVVTPKFRVPQPDYRVWIVAFVTVGLMAAGILFLSLMLHLYLIS